MKLTKETCIEMLQKKATELERFPKKSDFSDEEVNQIKGHLGPWPRALEAAGVKEQNKEKIAQKRVKRLRARENQKKYRKEHPKNK